MAIVRRTRRHSGDFFQRRATDAFRYVGEQCVVVKMADVFSQPETMHENDVYDPIYKEVVKTEHTEKSLDEMILDVFRCWAIIQSADREKRETRTGVESQESVQAQIEPHIDLRQGDFVIRYDHWRGETPIGELKRYRVEGRVDPATIRDGSYSSGRLADMGQALTLVRIPETDSIFRWSPKGEVHNYRQGALTDYYNEGRYGLGNYGG